MGRQHMDMLITLYSRLADMQSLEAAASEVRKPLAPEHDLVIAWVGKHFTPGWASEVGVALANRPVSLFVATQSDDLLGFCCYDAAARGFVGPIGVAERARGGGLGAALLRACLHDMRAAGYAYAVAGAVGAPEFFRRVAGATEIEGSTPGIYRGMLKP
jgi:ribosomal protein S18 acetylase RimI-like enzyme